MLKGYSKLMKTASQTFLRVDDGAFVQAASPNHMIAIPDGSAIPVTNYTAETTAPALVAFTLSKQVGHPPCLGSTSISTLSKHVTKVAPLA